MISCRTRLVVLTLMAVVIGVGCTPDEGPQPNDAEEIRRYLAETEEGRELFRTEGLIPTAAYIPPWETAGYRDSVLEVRRNIVVRVNSYTDPNNSQGTVTSFNYGSLGFLREARATVYDTLVVQTIIGRSTSIDTVINNRALIREAVFLKLGSDFQPFLGWLMWGFRSGQGAVSTDLPVRFTGTLSDGTNLIFDQDAGERVNITDPFSIAFNQRYFLLNEVPFIPDGDDVGIATETRFVSSPTRHYTQIAWESDSGFVSQELTRRDDLVSADTVAFASGQGRFWNIVFVQVFADDAFLNIRNWAAPYRSPL